MTRQADAALGQHVAWAFDMFARDPLILAPSADPRLLPDWTIKGYIVAQDVILHQFSWLEIDAPKVCYGYLAESKASPGQFIAVIRGTASMHEWALDAKFALVSHPCGGHAEAGFYGVYQTMRFQPIDALDSDAASGIAYAIGRGAVSVIGHSLGAALASYLAMDVSAKGANVRARLYASPRPGDQGFADAFKAHVSDAVSWVREHDLVPEAPQGFGYLPLHCLQLITSQNGQAIIRDNPFDNHHIYSYLSDLYYGLMDWKSVPDIDRPLIEGILGPRLFAA